MDYCELMRFIQAILDENIPVFSNLLPKYINNYTVNYTFNTFTERSGTLLCNVLQSRNLDMIQQVITMKPESLDIDNYNPTDRHNFIWFAIIDYRAHGKNKKIDELLSYILNAMLEHSEKCLWDHLRAKDFNHCNILHHAVMNLPANLVELILQYGGIIMSKEVGYLRDPKDKEADLPEKLLEPNIGRRSVHCTPYKLITQEEYLKLLEKYQPISEVINNVNNLQNNIDNVNDEDIDSLYSQLKYTENLGFKLYEQYRKKLLAIIVAKHSTEENPGKRYQIICDLLTQSTMHSTDEMATRFESNLSSSSATMQSLAVDREQFNLCLVNTLRYLYGMDMEASLQKLCGYDVILTKHDITAAASEVMAELQPMLQKQQLGSPEYNALGYQINYLRQTIYYAASSEKTCQFLLNIDVVKDKIETQFSGDSYLLLDKLCQQLKQLSDSEEADTSVSKTMSESNDDNLSIRDKLKQSLATESETTILGDKKMPRASKIDPLDIMLEQFCQQDYQSKVIDHLVDRIKGLDIPAAIQLIVYHSGTFDDSFQSERVGYIQKDLPEYSSNNLEQQHQFLKLVNRTVQTNQQFFTTLDLLAKADNDKIIHEYCQRMPAHKLFEMIFYKEGTDKQLSLDEIRATIRKYPIASRYCIFHILFKAAAVQYSNIDTYDYRHSNEAFYTSYKHLINAKSIPNSDFARLINDSLEANKPWNFVLWESYASPLRLLLRLLARMDKATITKQLDGFNKYITMDNTSSFGNDELQVKRLMMPEQVSVVSEAEKPEDEVYGTDNAL